MANLTARMLAPLLLTTFVTVMASKSGAAVPPEVDPRKEAEIIAVESIGSLLPDPKLTQKIQKDVALIRQQHDGFKNVRNLGTKLLGKLSVVNYTPEVLKKINSSKFGRATVKSSDNKDGQTVIKFSKPYNPDKLASKLRKLGVTANPIFRPNEFDFGDIEYQSETGEYKFRQGFENCKPKCTENISWTFLVTDGKAEVTEKFATPNREEVDEY